MTVVDLVFDEGPDVGLGHRRRMEALGTVLATRGVVVRHRATGDASADPPAEVTVVDSYRRRADDGSFGAGRVAALDDLGRDLEVDLVVRPCPAVGGPIVERATRVLTGFEFALLGPIVESGPAPAPDAAAPVVLVTLGGSDLDGQGASVATAIARALRSVAVRHAPGPWSRRSTDPSVVTVDAPDGLGPELAAAQVVVTAGGVTMLESLAMGRPTVVVVTADNQRSQADAVRRAGAALVLDRAATSDDVVDAVQALLSDDAGSAEMAARGRSLIDGRGADRVAEAILELT